MRKKKIVILIAVALFSLWVAVAVVDYELVHHFYLPVFCVRTLTYWDGGSGTYTGLGYSFDIRGHFFPGDEQPGVTEYTYRLFGLTVETGKRPADTKTG